MMHEDRYRKTWCDACHAQQLQVPFYKSLTLSLFNTVWDQLDLFAVFFVQQQFMPSQVLFHLNLVIYTESD